MAGHDDNERPQFARGSAVNGDAPVELRGECPRGIVDVLDAISMARDMTRTALVNEILGEWRDRVLHEHSFIARVVRVHPLQPEAAGGAAK